MNGDQVINYRSLLLKSEVCKRIDFELAYIVALESFPTSGEPGECPAGAEVSSDDTPVMVAVDDEPSGMDFGDWCLND